MTILAALLVILLSRLHQLVPARDPAAGPAGLAVWSAEQIDLIRQQVCPGATDDELAFFAQVCRHRQLDPFAGEIVGIMRWDKKAGREVMKIQPTVEGLRTIAMRTGLYGGQDPMQWCGPDGEWRDIWPRPDRPPYAAKTAVYRVDLARPFPGLAHYHEFVQLDKGGGPQPMWAKMPANQLAKCAERQALIRAFKKELRAAGFNVDEDLSAPSRVSMECREIGLDDDGRHALVYDVTGGRTDSTRDLTPDEVLATRSEVARRRGVQCTAAGPGGTETYWVDPDTGEIVDPPEPSEEEPGGAEEVRQATAEQTSVPGPDLSTSAERPDPAPDGPGYVDAAGRIRVPDNEAPLSSDELERRRLTADLVPRARALDHEGRSLLYAWLDGTGIGSAKKVKDYTLDELRRLAEALTEFEKMADDEEPF